MWIKPRFDPSEQRCVVFCALVGVREQFETGAETTEMVKRRVEIKGWTRDHRTTTISGLHTPAVHLRRRKVTPPRKVMVSLDGIVGAYERLLACMHPIRVLAHLLSADLQCMYALDICSLEV